jgi:hypothetical protein
MKKGVIKYEERKSMDSVLYWATLTLTPQMWHQF